VPANEAQPVSAVTRAWCLGDPGRSRRLYPLLLLARRLALGLKGLPLDPSAARAVRAGLAAGFRLFRLRHAQTGQSNHSWLGGARFPRAEASAGRAAP